MTDLLFAFIQRNFLLYFLLIGFIIIVSMRKFVMDMTSKYMWQEIFYVFLLSITDGIDIWCGTIEGVHPVLHTFVGTTGYVIRPGIILTCLYPVTPKKYRKFIVIPEIINIIMVKTAYFIPLVVNYQNGFERGILGFIPFVVSFLYLLMLFVFVFKHFYHRKKIEAAFIIFCLINCVISSFFEMESGILNISIMIAIVFYYIFLREICTDTDDLTGIQNRHAYYSDCQFSKKNIIAVASIDMNGLKVINDTKGHAAGDSGLKKIAEIIKLCCTKNSFPYRMGGDEFSILFEAEDSENIEKILGDISSLVQEAGYSVSVGYALKSGDETIEEMNIRADKMMYMQKQEYYKKTGLLR